MKKSYLLLYSDLFGSREQVRGWIDSIEEIRDWRFELPNCFYIVSASSAEELHDLLMKKASPKGSLLIVEYSSNSQGRLSSESWYLLENKKRKPESK